VGLEPVAAPYDGKVFIADTSAWAHSDHPRIQAEWLGAIPRGQIATTPIVAFEVLRSARNGDEFDAKAADLADLRDVPITRSVTNAAIRAFRELAHRQPLFHRSVTNEDLLIAAAAQDAAVGVLHYDADFDTLATVLEFESRWIAPAGSL
jgi:predicted nucleic acid-binding protein